MFPADVTVPPHEGTVKIRKIMRDVYKTYELKKDEFSFLHFHVI